MEALINFQTMCADLTGMEIANASLLDEGTAAAEAMTLAKRSAKSKSNMFFVSSGVHPQTLEVLRTRAEPLGIELRHRRRQRSHAASTASACCCSTPTPSARSNDYQALADAVHARGGLVAVATDLLALTLIAAPGEWGADIVVGNSQRFGVPFGFGGPHAAFMACRDAYKRSMPGRLIGVSVDAEGKPRLPPHAADARAAHPPREGDVQHLHRAGAAGGDGVDVRRLPRSGRPDPHRPPHASPRRDPRRRAAQGRRHRRHRTSSTRCTSPTSTPPPSTPSAEAARINLRTIDGTQPRHQPRRDHHARRRRRASRGCSARSIDDIDALDATTADALPSGLLRTSAFLQHPVFNTHHSEHELLRYMRSLADKDLAMDRTMIPLG